MPRLSHDRLAIDGGREMQLVPPADGVCFFVPHAHLQGRVVVQRHGVDGQGHSRREFVIEDGTGGNDRWPHWPITCEHPFHFRSSTAPMESSHQYAGSARPPCSLMEGRPRVATALVGYSRSGCRSTSKFAARPTLNLRFAAVTHD